MGTEKCPVCGGNVSSETAPKVEYRDKTYYFCCGHCKEEFENNPGKYTDKSDD